MKILTTMEEIAEVIYTSKSLEVMQERHIKLFESKKNLADTLIVGKLREYVQMTKKNGLENLARKLKGYEKFMKNSFDEMGIETEMSFRTKDYVGFLKKAILYLQKGKPLGRLMDIHGFRWIIGTQEEDDELSHNLCDLAVNMSLLYLTSHGWILMEAEPPIETEFNPDDHPDIYINSKNLIFRVFENNIKDYLRTVKKNGYQRTHFYIKSPEGLLVEGQFGTKAMNERAENGSSENHFDYKDERYKDVGLVIDPFKIASAKFKIDESGIITDPEGIIESIVMKI